MTKRADLPLSKHHILVYDEDWEFLEQHYGGHSASKLGISSAIRTIIHAKVLGMKAQMNARIDARASSSPSPLAEKELER